LKIFDIIPRVIPCLLLKGQGLYKGKNFKNHRYIGDPINTVRIFNEKKADELVFFDIESTRRGNINFDLIKQIAGECFMPFAYGGGIRNLFQIEELIKLGVEKVVINTHGILNKNFFEESVKEFGSSSISFCLDYKKDIIGRKRVYINSGNTKTNFDPINLIKILNDIGVGEIIINSIEREGTKNGLDLDYFDKLSKHSNSPVIISGGCKDFDEIKIAINERNIIGISGGACFVFKGKHDAVLISYPELNY
tara:strand:- start:3256 stop:4008 length:753 start_codon:yes stop_codon:yes gene_type:complete